MGAQPLYTVFKDPSTVTDVITDVHLYFLPPKVIANGSVGDSISAGPAVKA